MLGRICIRKVFSILLSIVFLLGLITSPVAQAQTEAPFTPGPTGLSFRYVATYGVTSEPYLVDSAHINGPLGMFIDAGNNLYVAENMGNRVLMYNSNGQFVRAFGRAGTEWHHDNFINYPRDVSTGPDGNTWILTNSMIKVFDADSNVVRRFPADDPWAEGDDNGHFRNANGLAFNSSSLLFVADSGNHRVQVYDVSGGAPVYVNTIGETNVAESDNLHFNYPNHLDTDSTGALFVLDANNYRVQKCTTSDNWAHWTCAKFFGGNQGDDPANGEMNWSQGLHVDASNNVFIADGSNSRVLKCSPAGTCAHFVGTPGLRGAGNSVFGWAADVATDSSGNVYVSDTDNRAIKQYSSAGVFIKIFAGTPGVSYLTDTQHLNGPWGIATDSAGNMYISENKGHRLLKLNASGVQQWAIGTPGNFIFEWNNVTADNQKFSNYWAGLEGNSAIDTAGNIYIADTSNDRVQVYKTSDGSHVATMGAFREGGSGNSQFACPAGVAINPVNGDILVVDKCNQRVQVFNSDRTYKTTIGVPGETGSDATHLNNPWGVAVSQNGTIYIADAENFRVQKCTLAGVTPTCTTFLGEVGVSDAQFNHMHPMSVAVDASGRVYVADDWNTRVLVYNSAGAFLTSISGSWGQNHGQLVSPYGIAVDSSGNVYISDPQNHRVEKYAPNFPRWVQTNLNGFGSPSNENASRMSVHQGRLYASTNNSTKGGEVWRTADGRSWGAAPVASGGFNTANNQVILVGDSYNGYLYAGTRNDISGGEIWRCAKCDGTDWTQVMAGSVLGSSYPTVQKVNVHANALYAVVEGNNGLAVMRSTSGAAGSWSKVNTDGFGSADNTSSWAAVDFNGYYYVGTSQGGAWGDDPTTATGTEVWRCAACTGSDWQQVNADGFGDSKNAAWSIASFNGSLYVATSNIHTGGQVWMCTTCDGTDWTRANEDGFNHPSNLGGHLVEFNKKLYAISFENWNVPSQGVEVFEYQGGTDWLDLSIHGWGDSNNSSGLAGIVFNNSLYVTTNNTASGTEVWMYLGYRQNLPMLNK